MDVSNCDFIKSHGGTFPVVTNAIRLAREMISAVQKELGSPKASTKKPPVKTVRKS